MHFLKNLFIPKTVLDPIHPFVTFLNGLVSVCFLYNTILISYSSVFYWTIENSQLVFHILNLLADIVYFVDFTVSRMFTYVDKNTGNIITDPKLCQWNYFCSLQFKLDIIANMPFEWILGIKNKNFGISPEFWCYTRINRILKFSTFFRFAEHLQTNTKFTTFWRIGLTTFYLVLFVHMDACVYYKISSLQNHNTTWGLNLTIKHQFEYINGESIGHRTHDYFQCFYWSFMTCL